MHPASGPPRPGAAALRTRGLSRHRRRLRGVALWQHQEAQDAREAAQRSQRQAEELASVLAAPDARAHTAKLPDGARGTVVVSRDRNKADFLTSGLPRPPEGKVYQLWFSDAGTMRPAGLMDPAATNNAVLMDGPVNAASGMGITIEPAGGSPEPTSGPLALVNLPA